MADEARGKTRGVGLTVRRTVAAQVPLEPNAQGAKDAGASDAALEAGRTSGTSSAAEPHAVQAVTPRRARGSFRRPTASAPGELDPLDGRK